MVQKVLLIFECGKSKTEITKEWSNFIENKMMKDKNWVSQFDRWEWYGGDSGQIVASKPVKNELLTTILITYLEKNGFEFDGENEDGTLRFAASDPFNVPTTTVDSILG